MYFDNAPCETCGSEVRLEARRGPVPAEGEEPVGQPGGIVGDADSTVDQRVCTNPDCPTNRSS